MVERGGAGARRTGGPGPSRHLASGRATWRRGAPLGARRGPSAAYVAPRWRLGRSSSTCSACWRLAVRVARDAEAVRRRYGESVVDWARVRRRLAGPLRPADGDRAQRRAALGEPGRAAPRGARRRAAPVRADAVTPDDRDRMTLAWHRLDPWPDVGEGLLRLRQRVCRAVLERHIALQVGLARHGGCPGTPSSAPRSPARTSPTPPSTCAASRPSGSGRRRR